jgi:hypothetical protein
MKNNNYIRPILFVCFSYIIISFKYSERNEVDNLITVFLLLFIFYMIDVLFPSFIIYETINE